MPWLCHASAVSCLCFTGTSHYLQAIEHILVLLLDAGSRVGVGKRRLNRLRLRAAHGISILQQRQQRVGAAGWQPSQLRRRLLLGWSGILQWQVTQIFNYGVQAEQLQ